MAKERKLMKDCKPGDPLWKVYLPKGDHSGSIEYFLIKEIKHDSFSGDRFILESPGLDGVTREFRHKDSERHDSLILDTDYAYGDDCRYYTTFDGARDYLVFSIQYDIVKSLDNLRTVERKYGPADEYCFIMKTGDISFKDRKIRKTEIIEHPWWADGSPRKIASLPSDGRTTVMRYKTETNYQGHEKPAYTYKDREFKMTFDSPEEANAWMKKNDESFKDGKSVRLYKGYRYYINND